MKLKTEDLLIYGGLLFVGYKVFIEKKTPAPTSFVPAGGTYIAPGTTTNAASNILQQNPAAVQSLLTTGGNFIKKLFPGSTPVAQPLIPDIAAPETGITNTLTSTLPGLVQSFAMNTAPAGSIYSSDTDYLMSLEEEQMYS